MRNTPLFPVFSAHRFLASLTWTVDELPRNLGGARAVAGACCGL